MFTGIIETSGQILELRGTAGGRRLTVEVSNLSEPLSEGDSLAINGVCLTAVNPTRQKCEFEVIKETLDRTNFGDLHVGSRVNLERSMSPTSRFDGHFVQGHVDAVAIVDRTINTPAERVVWFRHDQDLTPLIVPKGSITINGVSMTIAATEQQRFSVALIPTTLERTNLGDLKVGDRVNLETDILARTILHQLGSWLPNSDQADFLDKLRRHGFA